MDIEVIAMLLGAPVLSFISGIAGMYVQKRKAKAEALVIEETQRTHKIDNEFKVYSGYQSVSRDYAELADIMSEKFLKVKKELTLLKAKYTEELTILNTTIQRLKEDLDIKAKEVTDLTALLEEKSQIMQGFQADCEEQVSNLEAKMQEYIEELKRIRNRNES